MVDMVARPDDPLPWAGVLPLMQWCMAAAQGVPGDPSTSRLALDVGGPEDACEAFSNWEEDTLDRSLGPMAAPEAARPAVADAQVPGAGGSGGAAEGLGLYNETILGILGILASNARHPAPAPAPVAAERPRETTAGKARSTLSGT